MKKYKAAGKVTAGRVIGAVIGVLLAGSLLVGCRKADGTSSDASGQAGAQSKSTLAGSEANGQTGGENGGTDQGTMGKKEHNMPEVSEGMGSAGNTENNGANGTAGDDSGGSANGTKPETGGKEEDEKLVTVDGEVFMETEETVYVTASLLNLRQLPSFNGSVIGQAGKGEALTRIGRGKGEWDRLTDQSGAVFYAAGQFLSRYNPLAAENFTFDLAELDVVDVTKQVYTYEEMSGDLEELARRYPDYMELRSLGVTRDNRELYLVVLGNPDAENSVIIQASIHAREYMTALIAMKQLEYYLRYYDSGYYNGIPYSEIFDHTAIYLMPMLNPDGVTVSQSGLSGIHSEEIKEDIEAWYERDKADGKTKYSLEQYLKIFKANSYGVDLNRNFDMGWMEFGGSKYPGAEKYKGTAPGSEPESAALIELTKELQPAAAVSYHASGSVLYWDYGQTGEFRARCERLTKVIAGLTGYQMMDKGSDGGVDAAGYSDWAAGVMEIPAVTIEIGTGRAPLNIEEFQAIWNRNREVFAAVAAQPLEE